MSEDIYTYILHNFNIAIHEYTFTRDYIQNPLIRGVNQHDTEHFDKKDLEYLYISLNLRLKDLSSMFNVSEKSIRNDLKYYNIKKSPKLANKNTRVYFNKTYGVNTPSQVPSILDKQISTCLKKYNSRSSLWGVNKSKISERTNNISHSEIKWLDDLNIPKDNHHRQVLILNYHVDGYDPNTNTIYEFLGDYWHGNLQKFKSNDINPSNKMSFQQLYDNTFKRLKEFKDNGYNVIYIWESDYKKGLPYIFL